MRCPARARASPDYPEGSSVEGETACSDVKDMGKKLRGVTDVFVVPGGQ